MPYDVRIYNIKKHFRTDFIWFSNEDLKSVSIYLAITYFMLNNFGILNIVTLSLIGVVPSGIYLYLKTAASSKTLDNLSLGLLEHTITKSLLTPINYNKHNEIFYTPIPHDYNTLVNSIPSVSINKDLSNLSRGEQ